MLGDGLEHYFLQYTMKAETKRVSKMIALKLSLQLTMQVQKARVGGGLGREFFGVPGTSHGLFQKPGLGQSVPYWAYVVLWGLSWTSHGPLKGPPGSLRFHGPSWGVWAANSLGPLGAPMDPFRDQV